MICLMSIIVTSISHVKYFPLVGFQGVVNNPILEILRKTKYFLLSSGNHKLTFLE